ncbi:MAG: hypothetical protein EAX87_09810 [Candidatus Thorarchaeota archaeon]|nr:hypothetical protein [Candidatus Thorarchaeota archaeon]
MKYEEPEGMLVITRITNRTTDKLVESMQPYFENIFDCFRKMKWVRDGDYEKEVTKNHNRYFVGIYDDLFLQLMNGSSDDEVNRYLQQLYFDVTGNDTKGIVRYAVFPADEFDWGFDTVISLYYSDSSEYDNVKKTHYRKLVREHVHSKIKAKNC